MITNLEGMNAGVLLEYQPAQKESRKNFIFVHTYFWKGAIIILVKTPQYIIFLLSP